MNTYRLIVTGRVQGVNYRRFVVEMAETLGYGG
ncbi:MAG: acylphosphatase, partial [Epsilonproteobacteria bacterium]|nr:acylphosphatase [Campylobacterota bacterium]